MPGAAAVCAMDGFAQDNNKIAVQPIHQRTGGSRSLFLFIQSDGGIIDANSGGCQLGEILTLSDWFANAVRVAPDGDAGVRNAGQVRWMLNLRALQSENQAIICRLSFRLGHERKHD